MKQEKKPPIPIKDSIFLSPIDKYKLYGRFPWKMIIHIFLVIATSAQAILIIGSVTQYTRAQERIYYNNFVEDSAKTDMDYPRFTYLYNISQLINSVKRSIKVNKNNN